MEDGSLTVPSWNNEHRVQTGSSSTIENDERSQNTMSSVGIFETPTGQGTAVSGRVRDTSGLLESMLISERMMRFDENILDKLDVDLAHDASLIRQGGYVTYDRQKYPVLFGRLATLDLLKHDCQQPICYQAGASYIRCSHSGCHRRRQVMCSHSLVFFWDNDHINYLKEKGNVCERCITHLKPLYCHKLVGAIAFRCGKQNFLYALDDENNLDITYIDGKGQRCRFWRSSENGFIFLVEGMLQGKYEFTVMETKNSNGCRLDQ